MLPSLKAVNERLLRHTSGIVTFMGKLVKNLEKLLNIAFSPISYPIRGVKANYWIPYNGSRGRNYMQFLGDQLSFESVPYVEAIENKKQITQLEIAQLEKTTEIQEISREKANLLKDREQLRQQLAKTKDALAAKQSQHNNLLAELATTRQQLKKTVQGSSLSPEQQQELMEFNVNEETIDDLDMEEMDEEIPEVMEYKEEIGDDSDEIPDVVHHHQQPNLHRFPGIGNKVTEEVEMNGTKEEGDKPYTLIVLDENGNQSDCLTSELDSQREKDIKHYYETKLEQLVSQVKEADDKAMKFHEEYEKALSNLEIAVEEKRELKEKLQIAEEQLQSTKDELELTRANYEAQMKLFSEHIVTLNDKLLVQEEQLTTFKATPVGKAAGAYPAASFRSNKKRY